MINMLTIIAQILLLSRGGVYEISEKNGISALGGVNSPVFHTAITPNFNIYLQISLYGCNICRVR